MNSSLSVDVFLPVCGEPLDVLSNTWYGVQEVIEHNKNLVIKPWVLDDAASPEVHILANLFKFNYLVRDNRPYLKKAGNLRWAFQRTDGEYILILDADFRPLPEILDHLLPYMLDNPRCPIVQTPQFFETNSGYTFIQNGAAYVQELYYRLIQVIRNQWNASNCVGSCALYRRKALEPLGGTAEKSHSEDLWTGVLVQINGYGKVEYLPLNLTLGLCPDTVRQFYFQQYRWCAGTLALVFSKDFWKDFKVGFIAKYFYLQGFMYYFLTAIFTFIYPLVGICIAIVDAEHLLDYLAFTYFFKIVSEAGILAIWTKAKFGLYYFFARYVAYYSHVIAFWDILRGTPQAWVPTGVKAITKKSGYNKFIGVAIGFPTLVFISSILISLMPNENLLIVNSRYFFVLQQIIGLLVIVYPLIDEEFIIAKNFVKLLKKLNGFLDKSVKFVLN